MRNLLTLSFVLISSLIGSQLYAATWNVDVAHTTIEFTVQHMMINTVHGTFNAFTGSADFDESKPSDLSFQADIDANSVDTRNEKRDGHLRSPDFFDVEKTPKITFVSKKSEMTSPGHYKVTGDLTMRGVTKEITLDITGFSQFIKDPQGNMRTAATATGTVNREDFGLMWNKALEAGGVLVGKEVQINIETELVKKAADKS